MSLKTCSRTLFCWPAFDLLVLIAPLQLPTYLYRTMLSRAAELALDALRSAVASTQPLAEQRTGQKGRTLAVLESATLAITKFATFKDFVEFAFKKTSLLNSLSQSLLQESQSAAAEQLRLLLTGIAQRHRQAKKRADKWALLALVLESLSKYCEQYGKKYCTLKELHQRYGFTFSKKQLKTVRRWMRSAAYYRQVQPSSSVPPSVPESPRCGRPSSPHKAAIRAFFYRDDISHPAATRTRQVDGEPVAASLAS